VVACLVEILQVQSVVPNLINGGTIECVFSYLELNRKHYRSDEQYSINSTPHSWNVEFQEQATGKSAEVGAQEFNLGGPRIFLGLNQSKPTVLCEFPQHSLRR